MSECIVLNVSDAHNWSAYMTISKVVDVCKVVPREDRPSAIHPTRELAEKEAVRLASKEHGLRFAVFECVGIVGTKALADSDNVKGVGPCSALVPTWESGAET